MYVCLCKGVTDGSIKEAIDSGRCCSMKDLCKNLGVATQCGKCGPQAKSILKTVQSSLSSKTIPSMDL